jgi:hypothetical protein
MLVRPAPPPPPPLRLPTPRRRPGGFIVSLVLHAVILLLIARFGVEWVLGGGDDRFGYRGGGGGSGGSVHLVDLPASAPPAPAAPVPQPAVHTVPPPELAVTLTPPAIHPISMTVAPVVASVGTASDGTTGQGPGTGGGTGAGVGPGVGNDSGPGSGGNGAYLSPSPRVVLLPASCARGSFTVLFSVAADGHVAHVTVDPQPKDGTCRRAMVDKMMGYEFIPARNRNGQLVADTVSVKMSQ